MYAGQCTQGSKTEYGLRLATMVLSKIKEVDCHHICMDEEVTSLIKAGDQTFYRALDDSNVGDNDDLKRTAAKILQKMPHYVIETDCDEPFMSNEVTGSIGASFHAFCTDRNEETEGK